MHGVVTPPEGVLRMQHRPLLPRCIDFAQEATDQPLLREGAATVKGPDMACGNINTAAVGGWR